MLIFFVAHIVALTDYSHITNQKSIFEWPPVGSSSIKKDSITIAIHGDSGVHGQAQVIYRMAKDNADMVIHPGDLAYLTNGAGEFTRVIDTIMGPQFPYLATLGDHDINEEHVYKDYFSKRNHNIEGLECSGTWGTASLCTFNGMVFVGMGLMFKKHDYEEFLHENLPKYENWPWKFCFWHRVNSDLQPGHKTETLSTHYYDLCRQNGFIIINGHEHLYGRTHSIFNFTNPRDSFTTEWSEQGMMDKVRVGNGSSFVLVSGLAGGIMRKWNSKRVVDPYWASVIGKQNTKDHGCLFCTFGLNIASVNQYAKCEFVDINGVVWDKFEIESSMNPKEKIHKITDKRLIRTGRPGFREKHYLPRTWWQRIVNLKLSPYARSVTNRVHKKVLHSSQIFSKDKFNGKHDEAFRFRIAETFYAERSTQLVSDSFSISYNSEASIITVKSSKPLSRVKSAMIQINGPSRFFPAKIEELYSSAKFIYRLKRLFSEKFSKIRFIRQENGGQQNQYWWNPVHWISKESSANTIWMLSIKDVLIMRRKGMWLSPKLENFNSYCYNQQLDTECQIKLETDDIGQIILEQAFEKASKYGPRIEVNFLAEI